MATQIYFPHDVAQYPYVRIATRTRKTGTLRELGEVVQGESQQNDGGSQVNFIIFLPLPDGLDDAISANYEQGRNWAEVAKNVKGAAKKIAGKVTETASKIKQQADSQQINLLEAAWAGLKQATKQVVNTGTEALPPGFVRNPMTTFKFTNVSERGFTFNWTLAPRERNESDTLKELIRALKLTELPVASAGGLLWTFPDECDIDFFIGNSENKFLPKIQYSVITNVSVSYTGAGQMSVFTSGGPVAITLSVTFQELTLPVREIYAGTDYV